MPSRDHITPVDSPLFEETLRQSVSRVADHCAAIDHTVGRLGADVARVHQRLDAWGCPSLPDIPPMRPEYHSSPEEVRELAGEEYVRRRNASERAKSMKDGRDRRVAIYGCLGLVGAEVIEHVLRLLLAGHL